MIYRFISLCKKKLNDEFVIKKAQYCRSKELKNHRPTDFAIFRKIVVLKLDAIGDFIIWLDAAKEYRKIYPEKELVLICNVLVREIAEKLEYFDTVIAIKPKEFTTNLKYRRKISNQLENLFCDVVIQAVYTRTFEMDFIASIIPAKQKIAMDGDCINQNTDIKANTDKIYDVLIDTPSNQLMETRRNGCLISYLTGKQFNTSVSILPKLITMPIFTDNKYVVLIPGGSNSVKQWAVKKFAQVATYVVQHSGFDCLICGSSDEGSISKEILKYSNSSGIIDCTGKTSIPELIEVIRTAEFVISNDTSGVHIAAATNTQSICLAGGWMYGRFIPYDVDSDEGRNLPIVINQKLSCYNCGFNKFYRNLRCLRSIAHGKVRCIEEISVSDVIFIVDRIIKNT